MKDDVRYSEFLFLQAVASGQIKMFDGRQAEAFSIHPNMYSEMAAALIEDLCIRFENRDMQYLVARLRGELSRQDVKPRDVAGSDWYDPRGGIHNVLTGQFLQPIRITYRGLRHIEQLRDLLRRDRILEDFGVLLSIRYFRRDLEDALQRSPDVTVSVLYADMDDFGKINKHFGQAAGDVVMKAYLEVVRDSLGLIGEGYRGVGDETCALILGQGHDRAVEIAEAIRKGVEALQCSFKGKQLPRVTASIGVATTPPEGRTLDVETAAEDRKRQAKQSGKNRVAAS